MVLDELGRWPRDMHSLAPSPRFPPSPRLQTSLFPGCPAPYPTPNTEHLTPNTTATRLRPSYALARSFPPKSGQKYALVE